MSIKITLCWGHFVCLLCACFTLQVSSFYILDDVPESKPTLWNSKPSSEVESLNPKVFTAHTLSDASFLVTPPAATTTQPDITITSTTEVEFSIRDILFNSSITEALAEYRRRHPAYVVSQETMMVLFVLCIIIFVVGFNSIISEIRVKKLPNNNDDAFYPSERRNQPIVYVRM